MVLETGRWGDKGVMAYDLNVERVSTVRQLVVNVIENVPERRQSK